MKMLLVVLSLGLAACGSPNQSHGGPVRDHVSLVDALSRAGLSVQPVGPVTQPFLHPQTGTRLRIGGPTLAETTEIQSFEYASAGAARADASTIQPNGQPRNASVDWVAPPHFFLKERILVIYVGRDPAVVKLLGDTLGPPVAGGENSPPGQRAIAPWPRAHSRSSPHGSTKARGPGLAGRGPLDLKVGLKV